MGSQTEMRLKPYLLITVLTILKRISHEENLQNVSRADALHAGRSECER
jgi:hypothetical protein